ncbi:MULTISPECIES: TonB-dependent receptor [Shewanella]|uniref:TonB-dependent receptor n=1 Tax=Shewanella fidelis TaxID=173509 RepID=A0AAW8NJU1_9GAMM|nr:MULTISPECIES: TonB-dependent receptor [Shewanella]MDR8523030.1 TonB-dependent receptor [Shewanella fidelis]MDW4811644.1 TonB-dependent receptor [Shewanella fidelis]MDW4815765.1 TonB-dependent receptor [Shewanella fidelis]MDW4819855.1 TonB-dependent receptor [Shewanella fidelis]MDW4824171.1 TonB-dependent receptor [Shewanella fidelis]
MKHFRYSMLAIACASTFLPAMAYAEEAEQALDNVERITVYGRQNQVVMNSGLATKSDMSLMETPAAVVVVDQELIQAQAVTNLQDLVRNISGVTQAGNNYGIGDNLVIRGLGANYTYDGMYGGAGLGNTFNPTRSLTNVESVEVLKGPATGLYGMGSAGGVINLIEKKPQFESNHSFTAEVGQWDTYSLEVDSTAAITDDLAYRVVAKSARSDGYRDIGTDRDEIYTSLKYVVNDSQDLTFAATYIKDAIAVDSIGHPIRIFNAESVGGKTAGEVTWEDLINDPNNKGIQLTEAQRKQLADSLASSDGLTPYAFGHAGIISPMAKDNEGEELRFKLTHNIYFSDNLFLNQQLQYRDYTSGFARQTGAYNYVYWDRRGAINADPRAPLVEDGVLYPFAARRQEYRKVDADESSWQYFADLRYDFQIGDIDNELLINANYEDRTIAFKQYSIYDADKVIKDKAGNTIYQGSLPYIYDIRNPNWGEGSFEDYDPLLTSNYDKTVSAWGVGVQHVGYLGYGFTSRIGVAFNQIKQTYEHLGVDPRYSSSRATPTPEADTTDDGITYNLGLTYMPTDNLSFFVNHSKGRTAYSILGSIAGNDTDRDDSESVSDDLGMRFKAFDDQMLASLVFFKSSRTNLQYNNPDYDEGVSGPSVPKYYYNGSEETTGVEFDMNAHLNDQWMVNVNAVYQDARDKKDPNRSSYDTRQKGVPYVTASAWVTYGADWFSLASPINISLGANYVDERSTNSTSFGIPDGYVPSYTVLDTAISYDVDDWKLQLNVNNLFNEEYYSKAMFLGGMPGEERNAKLTLTYRL